LFYLYQNDQLPFPKKSSVETRSSSNSSVKDFFSRTFQKNKNPSTKTSDFTHFQQPNQPAQSIPQPVQSSTPNTTKSNSKKTRIPTSLSNKFKSTDETESSSKSSDEGPSEFKRL